MERAELRQLLKALRATPVDLEGKRSRWEVLVDFLEIVAVACGKKSAHLQGEGQHSESLIRHLETTVARYGLRSLRKQPMVEFLHWPRNPNYEPAFFEWQRTVERKPKPGQRPVLWVFKEPAIEDVITRTVSGDIGVSAALGYPECCVRYHDELGVQLSEMLVEGFKREHGARSVEDLIRLTQNNARVRLDMPHPERRIRESATKFPFVQFIACERCLSAKDSPAARQNREMKKLARTLSRFLHDRIVCARRTEFQA